MAGIELVKDKETKEPFPADINVSGQIINAAMERGLILYQGNGNVDGVLGDHVLIGPPLTITREQVEALVSILRESIEVVEKNLNL